MNTITMEKAFTKFIEDMELNNCGAMCTNFDLHGDVYLMEVRTFFQSYSCVVSVNDGEILGVSAEPVFDMNLGCGSVVIFTPPYAA